MGTNDSPTNAVCDTGPIIHLDELESLNLLADFRLWIPKAVWQELHLLRRSTVDWLKNYCHEQEPPESIPSKILALGRALSLDNGETEALSILPYVPQPIFLTDDAAARLAAQQLGFQVHGTIGILIRAIRRRQLTAQEVIQRLRAIPGKSSLFIRPSLLHEVIEGVQKEFNRAL